MSPKPQSVALLGGGIFARTAHLPALAETPTLKLAAVYSRSSASATALATAALEFPTTSHATSLYFDVASEGVTAKAEGGLQALLDRKDIETVILSLPINLQAGIIEQCFKSGKNVISEKPVAQDLKEATALIELYEKEYKPKGVFWIIAEQFPFEPAIVKAKELISKIGTLRSFDLEFSALVEQGTKYIETAWRKNPTYQGGFLLDGGVHWSGGLRYLLGSVSLTSIIAISAQIQSYLPPADTLRGLLKTSSGANGAFTLTFAQEGPPSRGYVFRGSEGTVTLDMSTYTQILKFTPHVGDEVKFEYQGRAVKEEFLAFGEALVAGIESEKAKDVDSRSGPRATLKDLKFIEAALTSGTSGQWVDL